MGKFAQARLRLTIWLAVGLIAGGAMRAFPAQASQSPQSDNSKPQVLKPDAPGMGRNHRLILKDGSYQVVRQYQIVGDRVRYLSQERGDWEELPVDLVDWAATRKWEQDHSATADEETSPAMKEAEEIDKEESDERDDQKARMPEVSKGLELPDEEGVFVLDAFHGTPELVELTQRDLDIDAKSHHGIGVLNPLAEQKARLELSGAHAKVHLHVDDPAFYISLGVTDQAEPVLSHPFTVDTTTAQPARSGKHSAHSAQSGFAVVRLDQRQAVRLVRAIQVSPKGAVIQDDDVMPAKAELMPGKHWLKLELGQKLVIGGEYALIEIISPQDISTTVWDFRVDPTEGDNPGSLTPILSQTGDR
jgi:hypothetical protein